MKRIMLLIAAVCGVLSLISPVYATRANDQSKTYTLAVFGDWPYSQALLNAAPTLLDSINSDPEVRLVLHIGDIHSGSMPCTGAGLTPVPPGANPTWNQGIFAIFQQFQDPVVYTPGDNEWTDCHKAKEFSSGAPLNELAAVRQLFFARPGRTLGQNPMHVESQAKESESDRRTDPQFVENVRWDASQVVFVTLNVPGSNNDTLPWTGVFSDTTAQAKEVADRTAADIRWLKAAFAEAREEHAKGVVIGLQADMWDPAALVPGGDGLSAYQSIVQAIADLSVKFGRPVLLINGDSHLFEVDQPLADPTSATGQIYKTQAVPNLTRITVQGSTNHPSEWLRLTIDPKSPQVFSWENVVYLP